MTGSRSEDGYKALATYVAQRRRELGIRQDQLAYGPSTTTMTQIESGERVSDLSYRKLDRSMGWRAGSALAAVTSGEEPVVEVAEPAHKLDPARDLGARRGRPEATWPAGRIPAAGHDRADIAWRTGADRPLIDVVWSGRQLAADKQDPDVGAYVRQVEAAVVGVIGVDRLADGLDGITQQELITRAVKGGVLEEFISDIERRRAAGVEGRELQNQVEKRLDELLLGRREQAKQSDFDLAGHRDVGYQSEGRRLREKQDQDAEATDLSPEGDLG